MSAQTVAGGRYRHLRSGDIYRVLAVSRSEAFFRQLVTYEGESGVWTRPLEEFRERFEAIPSEPEPYLTTNEERIRVMFVLYDREGIVVFFHPDAGSMQEQMRRLERTDPDVAPYRLAKRIEVDL